MFSTPLPDPPTSLFSELLPSRKQNENQNRQTKKKPPQNKIKKHHLQNRRKHQFHFVFNQHKITFQGP